jgi:hypothetical protein
MADASVLVLEPPVIDATGEVDAESLGAGPNGKPLRRERLQIGGAALAEIASVKNAAPAAGDYAVVVRTLLYDAAGNALVVTAGKLAVDGSGVVQPVSGAFFQATQPVSAAALPLPAGASSEATLALIKAKTDNLDVALSTRTKPADTQPVSAAALPLPAEHIEHSVEWVDYSYAGPGSGTLTVEDVDGQGVLYEIDPTGGPHALLHTLTSTRGCALRVRLSAVPQAIAKLVVGHSQNSDV